MAKSKKVVNKAGQEKLATRTEPLRSEEKIARLLGIIATQNLKWKPAQASLLRGAGFTNPEIAEMLDTSASGVADLIYKAKKGRKNDTDD